MNGESIHELVTRIQDGICGEGECDSMGRKECLACEKKLCNLHAKECGYCEAVLCADCHSEHGQCWEDMA